jgi:Tfp pilus assembly protein FimT
MLGFQCGRYPRSPVKAGRGVTFIELIILTLALVILASISIPRMSPVVQSFRLRGAAWQLGGDLRLARQRALTSQQRFRVCVSSCLIPMQEGQYSLERDIGLPNKAKWISETGTVIKLPPDVTISGGTATFSPDGMASGSTYTLKNLAGKYEVRVASTGQVRVCRGDCP